jgi:hypothetical protein
LIKPKEIVSSFFFFVIKNDKLQKPYKFYNIFIFHFRCEQRKKGILLEDQALVHVVKLLKVYLIS